MVRTDKICSLFNLLIVILLLDAPLVLATENNAANSGSETITLAETAPIKSCDPENINECFSNPEEANQPFEILHGKKTKYVALLLHGLSDSPYFYRDLAPILFNSGMNVIATRWSGHGTAKEDLSKVSFRDWLKDLEFAKQKALEHGEKVVVAGMSMGGLAASYLLISDQKNIAGGLIFSPALDVHYKVAQGILPCVVSRPRIKWAMEVKPVKWVLGIAGVSGYSKRKDYGKYVRYEQISANGGCELKKAVKHFSSPLGNLQNYKEVGIMHGNEQRKIYELPNGERVFDGTEKIRDLNFESVVAPVFTAITAYDQAVDVELALRFTRKIKNQENSQLLFVADDGEYEFPKNSFIIEAEELAHASVMLDPNNKPVHTTETNPHFDTMKKIILQWISKNKFDLTGSNQ